MRTRRPVPLALLTALALAGPAAPAAGPPPDAGKGDHELHVVGLYEGYTKSNGAIHGGKARVSVDRPGKRVTLALVAYDPVTWEVTATPATTLERVVLGGHSQQAAAGVPRAVPVEHAFRGGTTPDPLPYAYQLDSPEFRRLVDHLARRTDQRVASFAGRYAAAADAPFVVDRVQDDPQLSADYPPVGPTADLPGVVFRAHRYAAGPAFQPAASFGDFTLSGPDPDSLKPLPRDVTRVAFDPAGKRYYGIARHGVVEVDLPRQTAAAIDVGLAVPKLSWPSDLAFDTKRGRLLVTASTGGYLYAFDPATRGWAVLAEKVYATAVAYHPADDAVYLLKFGGGPVLHRLNASGAAVAEVRLDGPLVPGLLDVGPGVSGVQLVPAGDKLVLLAYPHGGRGQDPRAPGKPYLYLVDPKTGKARLTAKGF